MQASLAQRLARDLAAWGTVLIFLFPIAWWVLASIKPYSAIFTTTPVFADFVPTLDNYRVTLGGLSRAELAIRQGGGVGGVAGGASSYYSVQAILDSVVVAIGSTAIAVALATLAAYALSRMHFRGQQNYLVWVLSQRMMPPIAVAIPFFFMFRGVGLYDTRISLVIAHALINLPFAVLLMKSFFDDVPREIDESAIVDGASRMQAFRLIVLPMVKGGVAAAAVLCFIFSWTEFLLSQQLTSSIRTIPVKISTFVTSTGTEWGFITSLGTAAIVPSFIFILLVQRHLVRGLTMGSLKG